MNCVILQPSYIPWRGVFEQIYRADVFIFYDDVQYDKGGWRNRNRIKTRQGPRWLTIPVLNGGVVDEGRSIQDVRIDWQRPWNRKHWESLRQAYTRAPCFGEFGPWLETVYQQTPEFLADFTIELTIALARRLGIEHTRFLRASELGVSGGKTGRLVNLVKHVGASRYLSGPAAKAYLEEERFREAGIELEYMTYDYPEYPQLYPPYDPKVSILDLLFMTGSQALRYIIAETPQR